MRFTFSLFQKSLLCSAVITSLIVLSFFLPFTRPSPTDFSFELRPQILESLSLVWLMPLGLVAEFLLKIGLYPGNETTGLWGGPVTIFFGVTFFWGVIFYGIARIVQYGASFFARLKKS